MIHQMGNKLRGQINKFSGELCKGLGKVRRRFVEEMLLGIQARGSVRISEVAGALCEEISLYKTHERLRRNLGDPRVREEIGKAILENGSKRIGKDTLLIIDPSDLSKKYAKKMENLCEVRDGSSEGEIKLGYWMCEVIGAEVNSPEITPLAQSLWSQEADDFIGENDELLKLIRSVRSACEGRGIFVMDRGGDLQELYDDFLGEASCRFLIRQRGDRHILYHAAKKATVELAEQCPMLYKEVIVKEGRGGREKRYEIRFGYLPVRLPSHPERELYLCGGEGIWG